MAYLDLPDAPKKDRRDAYVDIQANATNKPNKRAKPDYVDILVAKKPNKNAYIDVTTTPKKSKDETKQKLTKTRHNPKANKAVSQHNYERVRGSKSKPDKRRHFDRNETVSIYSTATRSTTTGTKTRTQTRNQTQTLGRSVTGNQTATVTRQNSSIIRNETRTGHKDEGPKRKKFAKLLSMVFRTKQQGPELFPRLFSVFIVWFIITGFVFGYMFLSTTWFNSLKLVLGISSIENEWCYFRTFLAQNKSECCDSAFDN